MTELSSIKREAFLLGYAKCYDGTPRAAGFDLNPHPIGRERAAWWAGWNAGARLGRDHGAQLQGSLDELAKGG